MKAIARYVLKMSDEHCLYRLTVIELCKRGFSLSMARRMVKDSDLFEHAKHSWRVLRDEDQSDWANYVIKYHVKNGTLKLAC